METYFIVSLTMILGGIICLTVAIILMLQELRELKPILQEICRQGEPIFAVEVKPASPVISREDMMRILRRSALNNETPAGFNARDFDYPGEGSMPKEQPD